MLNNPTQIPIGGLSGSRPDKFQNLTLNSLRLSSNCDGVQITDYRVRTEQDERSVTGRLCCWPSIGLLTSNLCFGSLYSKDITSGKCYQWLSDMPVIVGSNVALVMSCLWPSERFAKRGGRVENGRRSSINSAVGQTSTKKLSHPTHRPTNQKKLSHPTHRPTNHRTCRYRYNMRGRRSCHRGTEALVVGEHVSRGETP